MKKLCKALFLDRDGVINVDSGYVYKKEEFFFTPGIFELCRFFQEGGYKIIVITNQSGIGRGLYSKEEFYYLTDWMKSEFKKNGILITHVYYCPHHPQYAKPQYRINCNCRKPLPGLFLDAIKHHNIDPNMSIAIGDKPRDIAASKAAGVKKNILLATQFPANSEIMKLLSESDTVTI